MCATNLSDMGTCSIERLTEIAKNSGVVVRTKEISYLGNLAKLVLARRPVNLRTTFSGGLLFLVIVVDYKLTITVEFFRHVIDVTFHSKTFFFRQTVVCGKQVNKSDQGKI